MKNLFIFILFLFFSACSINHRISDSHQVVDVHHKIGIDLDSMKVMCSDRYTKEEYPDEVERTALIYECEQEYIETIMRLFDQINNPNPSPTPEV